MLSFEELGEIVSQAYRTHDNITGRSSRHVWEVVQGTRDAAIVRDLCITEAGVFTLQGLRDAWETCAHQAGHTSGDYFYRETTEHNSDTYSDAFEIAVFGEITYG